MNNNRVPVILKSFVDGIVKAHGAAQQMVMHHQDPRFSPIHQKLSRIRDKSISIAMKATGVDVKHGRPR